MPTPPEDLATYRELYEAAPCGLMSTAPDGLILRINGNLCEWLGYSASGLVGQRRLQDLLSMGSRIFHQTHWQPLLQMQGSVAEVQLEWRHREGHSLAALVNARERSTEAGPCHEIAVFAAADRRRYERELLDARRRAEQLLAREREAQVALVQAQSDLRQALEQRAVLSEQLVGIVSHDLRNPMNTIVLAANILAATNLSQQQERAISRITSAAKRATRLISDLLDFTQARLGRGLSVSKSSVDAHALVQDCVEELRLSWPGRMIEHRALGDRESLVDPDRLFQLVTNLASNAMTYGDPERPVTVSTFSDEHELRLEVHNYGPAIPETLLPHIFEPMRRGDQQVKLGSRSVGLGLYIVQEIALAHAGHVTVRSDAQDGTCFVVHLPSLAR